MSAMGMDFGFEMPRMRPSQPHLRLTKRGRTVVTTLATVPLVVGIALLGLNGGGAVATLDEVPAGMYDYVTVAAGESLWGIANEIAPSADPRDVISEILEFNGMSSSQLFPGQQIAIPTQYSE